MHIPYAQETAVTIIVLILRGCLGDAKGRDPVSAGCLGGPGLYGKAHQMLAATPDVEQVKALRLRWAGSVLFADATIAIAEGNFHRAHEVANRAEA